MCSTYSAVLYKFELIILCVLHIFNHIVCREVYNWCGVTIGTYVGTVRVDKVTAV